MDRAFGTNDARRSPVALIVADHEDSAAMYAIFLLGRRFLAVTARTAQDGFNRACVVRPDIVIADMLLSDTSGLELTRRLRSDTRTKDAGIIVVAGHAVGSVREEANEAGCDRFLLKPVLPDVLDVEVVNLLRQRRGRELDSALARSVDGT
jgi:DNA-binding response OmpR family regulator